VERKEPTFGISVDINIGCIGNRGVDLLHYRHIQQTSNHKIQTIRVSTAS